MFRITLSARASQFVFISVCRNTLCVSAFRWSTCSTRAPRVQPEHLFVKKWTLQILEFEARYGPICRDIEVPSPHEVSSSRQPNASSANNQEGANPSKMECKVFGNVDRAVTKGLPPDECLLIRLAHLECAWGQSLKRRDNPGKEESTIAALWHHCISDSQLILLSKNSSLYTPYETSASLAMFPLLLERETLKGYGWQLSSRRYHHLCIVASRPWY